MLNTRYLNLPDQNDKMFLKEYEKFVKTTIGIQQIAKRWDKMIMYLWFTGKYMNMFGLPYGYGKFIWNSTVANIDSYTSFCDKLSHLQALELKDKYY